MPKDNSERIIDWPYSNPSARAGSVSIGGDDGASNLDALLDVSLSAPLNGQILVYNSSTGQWVNSAPSAATMIAHDLSGSYHTGKLNWSLINFAGSNLADIVTRLHVNLQGIGPNDHHNQAHVLATGTALGADHTISGASAGEVLRALTATTAAFDVLQHTDLGNVLPDQHHAQVHNIVGADHTITGSQFQVVGATATNTLGLLTATPAPGAAAALLRTDANGGIQLDTNLFYVDAANNRIGINVIPGAGPLGGAAALDIRAAATGDITQRIRQIAGQTQRLWRVEDVSGNELIVMDSVGNLQSGHPGFVSGLTGWQISPGGNAEFNNIWARGELHATVFVKDEVHATGGTLLVATAGVLHDDAIINSTLVDDDVLLIDSTAAGHLVPLEVVTTSGAFTGNQLHVSWIGNIININDPPSGPGFYFQPGDVLRSKTEVPTGVTDFWFTVNSATQNTGYSSYSVFKQSGTDGTLPKGAAVVSYGQQGDGRILMTSDWRNDLGYSPYIDVFTSGAHPWDANDPTAIIPRMRMGQLSGVGLPGISGVSQWGMVAGRDLSDANSGYFIASNLQFSLYKIDIRLNNGVSDTGLWSADGNLKIGSNIGALATTGFQVITTGALAGNVVIGNEATGNYIRWNQSSGILQVVGSLVTTDPGTSVSQSYVDLQDQHYDSLANLTSTGYAGIAQANAQTYGDAHRIVATGAIFTSASATTIAWASFTAMMASGGARTIAAGSATISTRTYLYVNIALAGTLTLTPTPTITLINQVGYILIAVADPATNGSSAASVTVVVGSTYISGGNIFTGSITASSIAAHTITAGQIAANTITANEMAANTITVTQIAPAYTNTITAAQSDATAALANAAAANTAAATNLTYSQHRRIIGVSGTWTAVDGDTITWASLQAQFADATVRTITHPNQSSYTLSSTTGRHYLYVNVASPATGNMVMAETTTLSTLGVDHALIAVVDAGTLKASISVVAGSTYISGDNIMTGSIITANIAARTIEAGNIASSTITGNEIAANAIAAGHINVSDLESVSSQTGTLVVSGALTVGVAGNIHSSGKNNYANATAGFFLGYTGSFYGFDIGNSANFLRWDGSSLHLQTSTPLDLKSSGIGSSDAIFNFSSWRGGAPVSMLYNVGGDGAFTFNAPLSAYHFTANDLLTINYTSGLTAGDVLKVAISGVSNAGSDTFHYDRSGSQSQLNYSGNMSVSGSFIAGGQVIANTNAMRIVTPFTPSSHTTPAGQVGEIRWDRNFIYVWTDAGEWRRATLNIFP